jgi:hypothetical protein
VQLNWQAAGLLEHDAVRPVSFTLWSERFADLGALIVEPADQGGHSVTVRVWRWCARVEVGLWKERG